VEIRISLLASGKILLDGHASDMPGLQARLARAHRSQDQVWYYKEGEGTEHTPQSMEIVQLVMKRKLPIGFSSQPDFSTYVDQFGKPHVRSNAAAPAVEAPFMPDVDTRVNASGVFARARTAAAQTEDGRGIALVTPARSVFVLPVPPRSAAMDAKVPALPGIPADRSLAIAVIAPTGTLCPLDGRAPELEAAGKAIPFMGFLIAFGYAGHKLWIFEGHPAALAEGLEGADILLIDSAMLPLLQPDWMAVGQRALNPPHRVLVHSRESYALVAAVPSAHPPGWAYAVEGTEVSYLNCLLTLLAKCGTGTSANLVAGAPLPELASLAQQDSDRQWVAQQPFRAGQLDASKAIEVFTSRRTMMQKLRTEWYITTKLGAEKRPYQFALRLDGDKSKPALSIRVM
jgi:hypothetical protein